MHSVAPIKNWFFYFIFLFEKGSKLNNRLVAAFSLSCSWASTRSNALTAVCVVSCIAEARYSFRKVLFWSTGRPCSGDLWKPKFFWKQTHCLICLSDFSACFGWHQTWWGKVWTRHCRIWSLQMGYQTIPSGNLNWASTTLPRIASGNAAGPLIYFFSFQPNNLKKDED